MNKNLLLTLAVALLLPLGTWAKQAYAVFTDDGTLTFYYDDQQASRTGTSYPLNEGSNNPGWYTQHRRNIKVAVFDASFADARPTSTHNWFAVGRRETSQLTTIKDMQYFNTSQVTTMHSMFYGCTELKSIATGSWDTRSVTDMNSLFYNCTGLTRLDLSNFDTSNVTDMSYMFYGCSSLTTIYCGNDWSTQAVSSSDHMFYDCVNLKGGRGTAYDVRTTDATYAREDKGGRNAGYFTYKDNKAYAVYDPDMMMLTFYYDTMRPNRTGIVYSLNDEGDPPGWCTDHGSEIVQAIIDPSFADARPTTTRLWFATLDWDENETPISFLWEVTGLEHLNTSEVKDMSYMFYGSLQLASIDLSSFNTSNVEDMCAMFFYCRKMTALDLSCFDTSNATNMSSMFYGCYYLTSLDLSSFDTSNVTDMSYMFYRCGSLPALNLEGFNTQNVTNMRSMFDGCYSLKSLNLSHFDTSNVTNMNRMFLYCQSLDRLNLRGFNTSNVTDMSWMFADCFFLTSLDLSSFDTSNVTNMSFMFSSCASLPTLNVRGFNTSNVTDMSWMFPDCYNLITLDLSSFDTSNVTDMSRMFFNCDQLTTIYCSDDWSTESVTEGQPMFECCESLVGGMGTTYDEQYTGLSRARIDGGPDNPGYFTRKPEVATQIRQPGATAAEQRYGLDGTPIDGKRRGLNIVRLKDGTARKVMVK